MPAFYVANAQALPLTPQEGRYRSDCGLVPLYLRRMARKIPVVEDNADARCLMSLVLARMGYEVLEPQPEQKRSIKLVLLI